MTITDTKVADLYRRIRRSRTDPMPAHYALSYAKSLANLPEWDWRGGGGHGIYADGSGRAIQHARFEQDGFEVVVRVHYDEGGPQFFKFIDDEPRVMPNLYANPNAWLDEEDEDYYGAKYRVRGSSDRYGWVDPEDTYRWDVTLDAKRTLHQGRSKQVAYEEAVREIRRWVEWVCEEDYTEVVLVVAVFMHGVELGGAVVGGVQVNYHDTIESFEQTCELMTIEHGLIDDAIDQAKDKLRELVGIDLDELKRAILSNEGKVLTPPETRRIMKIIEPAQEER